jgi:hypothetical protein
MDVPLLIQRIRKVPGRSLWQSEDVSLARQSSEALVLSFLQSEAERFLKGGLTESHFFEQVVSRTGLREVWHVFEDCREATTLAFLALPHKALSFSNCPSFCAVLLPKKGVACAEPIRIE